MRTKARCALSILGILVVAGSGRALAQGGGPLKRWSFKYDAQGWNSPDAHLTRSDLKAKDDGYSLKVDVSFPEPATLACPVSIPVDRVATVVYHVYVPADIPEGTAVKTMLFVKDSDGLWFQHFREEPLERGKWNTVSIDISATSPKLRPSGHFGVWGSVVAHRMSQLGIKFFCDRRLATSLYVDRILAYPSSLPRGPLQVLGLRENTLKVGRYGKFEVTFDINRPVSNPFEPDHVKIDATFIDPRGRATTVPAFYYQGFVRDLVLDREVLTQVGPGCWKARFAPVILGPYQYYLTVRYVPDRRGRAEAEEVITGKRSFLCVASESRGFVRVSKKDPMYFEFDNGEWFYPIGHNVHSPSDDTPRAVAMQRRIGAEILPDHGTFSYDRLFKKMADHGENCAEVWMCSWWLGIEWIADWKHYNGLTDYNLHNAWKLDYLVDLSERHDLYLHVVLENHGKASSWCDPEWEDNPYNKINGGFLDSPEEFFRNPIAKDIYRKVLRYIVARWAYSTRIWGLEVWSEVDLVGDSYSFHASDVAAAPKVQWHREMTEYLEQIDPWDHIRTTHFSTTYARIKSSLVSIPGLDYITCDAYRGSGSIIRLILATARAFAAHGKPGLVTEYGGSPFAATVPQLRADLHGGLWSTYMTHTAATPLLWWFQFIDADDLYWNFKALAAFHQGEDRRGQGLVPRTATFVEGHAHPDLSALCLQNQRMAYVWVYSRSAMEAMPKKGREPVFENITVRLRAMAAGTYRVEVWDTYKGVRVAASEITAHAGRLDIPIPRFHTDVALKVKPASGVASR